MKPVHSIASSRRCSLRRTARCSFEAAISRAQGRRNSHCDRTLQSVCADASRVSLSVACLMLAMLWSRADWR